MADSQKNRDDMTPEEREAFDKAEKKREEEEQSKLPYRWKQTLNDVDIYDIRLPKSTRGRDLEIVFKRGSIKVALKGQSPILEGELCKDVKVDDCTWSLEDGKNDKELTIHLEKTGSLGWWENVVKSAPKINTKTIQPENSKLSELDGETRAMVEKMMFDQRQKAMNLPDSEQLKKQDMFEKFKKQHPEMDFSKVKLDN